MHDALELALEIAFFDRARLAAYSC